MTSGGSGPEIVLVGGGHAHVQVLPRLAAAVRAGLRLTLVSRDLETAYSGMLPGHVAGLYRREDIHIDLVGLAERTGARLVHAAAIGIDRTARRVRLEGLPSLGYDVLSLDVGSAPDLGALPGAAEHAVAVKPVDGFLAAVAALRAAAADAPRKVVVLGGGAAGVELALALAARLRADARAAGLDPARSHVEILTSDVLVPTLNAGVRRRVARALAAAGVAVRTGERAVMIEAGAILLASGLRIAADAVVVATGGRAPSWLAGTGLDLAPDGSVAVRPTLQSTADDRIFAAGDCAFMVETPREKAGVFAVRQGLVLADNLLAAALGRPLHNFAPQRRFLVLLATGDGRAIGGRGTWLAVSGRWVWAWKDRIDRAFMARFQEPRGSEPVASSAGSSGI
ncbi:FAD-dependent oxidoreductase [Prosthecomicrobium sp. N25]|uniref:FAD-dependent oxidoreductase n=1 Tax=Prosthecomicrobium sp. N25 TaxID=3129254 RepID=UPI003077492A